jgi:hypothetical protein
MRILANYGYRNNGDTYSVTFETMGDVAKRRPIVLLMNSLLWLRGLLSVSQSSGTGSKRI